LKIVASIWVAALVAVSLQPVRPDPASELHQMHQPFHIVAFAITALVLRHCVVEWTQFPAGKAAIRASLGAVLGTSALGAVIELLQHVIYHNQMEWWDIRDDSLAAAAAICLAQGIHALVRQRRAPSS